MANTSVGQISLDLALNQQAFNKQMNALQKTTSNMMSKMVKAAGLIYAGKQLADFAQSWMELGSDLEEVQNVVDVTFTTMSDQVNKFAKNTMNTVGINETATKKYMGQFGSMSQAFSFTEEQAYSMSEALVKMGGDAASFNNASIDLAFTKLKSVFTGETETLKDWGIVMTQSALNQHALSKGINKTVQQMSEQEKVALRLNFVMQQLKLAQGDYLRTADNYANLKRTIELTFESAKTKMGQGFINLTAAMRTSILKVAQAFDVLAEKFLNFTRRFTKGKDVEGIKNSTSSITDEISNIGTETEETQKKVERFVAGFDKLNKVGSGDGNKTKTTNDNLINNLLAEALNYNMGEIQDKTKETNNLMGKLAEKHPKLSKSMLNLWDSLKGLAGISWDYIKIFWKDFLKPLGEYAVDNLLPAFLDVLAGLIKVITEFLKANKPLFKDILENILKPLGKILINTLVKALEWTAEKLEKLAGWMKENPEKVRSFTKALIALGAGFAVFMSVVTIGVAIAGFIAIISKAGGILAIIKTALAGVGTAIAGIGAPVLIVAGVIGVLTAALIWCALNWDKVKEFGLNCFNKLNESVNGFKEKMSGMPQWMKDIGSALLTNIMAPIKGIQEAIKTVFREIKELSKDETATIGDYIAAIFKGVINGIIAFMETTLNGAIRALNGITGIVPSITGDKAVRIPDVNLPRFANGGTVPGMGSRGGIAAIIGDVPRGHSEYALRDDQLEAFSIQSAINTAKAISSIGGIGSDGTMNVNLNLDGEKLASVLVNKNKKARMTTGRTAVI